MARTFVTAAAAGLILVCPALCQNPPEKQPPAQPAQSASELANALTRRLGDELHVRTVAGKPVTAGAVTLIPILMMDVNFGGASLAAPAGAKQAPPAGGDGFFMSGEARPLGFIAISRQGTRFISVAKAPVK